MQSFVLDHARALMDHPWIYLIVFLVTAVDSFLPVIPSEALVIICGVFAATQGAPVLPLVIAAGGLGAFTGDNISYFIGRQASGPVQRWVQRGAKRRRSFDWARAGIDKHGGVILILARYIPGGRTATTLTMGVVRWPHRRFMFFDAIATFCWSAYASLIGYLGGHAFERNPLLGALLGVAIATCAGLVVELIRRLRARSRAVPEQ